MQTQVVATNNLSKQYKYKKALDNFSITINKGDIYGLIGVNGAGKSTLLKIISGITEQDSGELYLFGSNLNLSASRKRIGSIIENPTFPANMSAMQALTYYSIAMDVHDEKSIRDRLIQVKLDPESNQPFKQFSLGMKQRLGIAFALLNNPEFVILDEPTNGLDPIGIAELRDVIQSLNKNGVTFLICSHILSELSQIATKYGIVHNGRFISEFTKAELDQKCHEKLIVKTVNVDLLQTLLNNDQYPYTIQDGLFHIYIPEAQLNSFIRSIVKNNIEILSFTQAHKTLEDVFMGIIQEVSV